VYLEGIKELYSSMKNQNIDKTRFTFTFHKTQFDVLFFIDSDPFELVFGAKGKNFFFSHDVKKGFNINDNLDSAIYRKLCEVLELKNDPNNRFQPKYFFEAFNQVIPKQASTSDMPTTSQIATYRDIKDEAHKFYFTHWIHHNGKTGNASPENLEKTRLLLGEKAYETCKRRNISSAWTDIELQENKDTAFKR